MIHEVHTGMGSSAVLTDARRTLFRMALEMLASDGRVSDTDASSVPLDNPLVMHAVQRALAGQDVDFVEQFRRAEVLAGLELLHPGGPALISTPESTAAVGDVAVAVGAGSKVSFLTSESTRFTESVEQLREGWSLLGRVVPDIAGDVLCHVTHVALLSDDRAGVRSASLRDFPGLLMLATNSSAAEAAEIVLHEAAHQLFFHLGIVCDLLPLRAEKAPPFTPSWRAPSVRWPIEQGLAALHAYSCLAALFDALTAESRASLTPASLLPQAADRAAELGSYAIEMTRHLGAEGRRFVEGLTRTRTAPDSASSLSPMWAELLPVDVARDIRIERHASAAHSLVARPGSPYAFYFLGKRSGELLADLADGQNVAAAVEAFAERDAGQAGDPYLSALRVLAHLERQELIAVHRRTPSDNPEVADRRGEGFSV